MKHKSNQHPHQNPNKTDQQVRAIMKKINRRLLSNLALLSSLEELHPSNTHQHDLLGLDAKWIRYF